MKSEMKRAKQRAKQRATLLRRALIIVYICAVTWGCDDAESERTDVGSVSVYDVEGPRGIVRERGPWLTRVGIPVGADQTRYELSVEVTRDISSGESVGGCLLYTSPSPRD